MKLIIIFLTFLSTFALGKDVNKIIDELNKKTALYKNISIDFELEYENEIDSITEKKIGKISIEGDKYRLEIDQQLIVSNSIDQWIYSKETNEVQIMKYDSENEFMNPSNLLKIYEKDYNFRYQKEYKINSTYYHVISLFPNEENNEILKIDLTIDKKKSIIKKIQAFESSGAIFSYNILKYKFDLKNLNFEFNTKEYEDIYIIDLR